jgi:geranylgeranyl diphosphate synthase type II
MTQFLKHYETKAEQMDAYLNGFFIRSDNKFIEKINKAMRYSLTASGKRLRPLMVMEFCKLFGGTEEDAIDFAASVEMIHTYSLIHDDLPAMDNDELRRGKPTNHVVFGEATAILAGDALLNYAYENMLSKALQDPGKMQRYVHAAKIIAERSGCRGMILGQVADMMCEKEIIGVDTLDYINQHKTGDLLKASMMAGAVIGGASREALAKVDKIGYNVGIAFQIIDDILDLEGSTAAMGKPRGSDLRNDKTTYPMLLGIDISKQIVKERIDHAIELLGELEGDTTFLVSLFQYLCYRER